MATEGGAVSAAIDDARPSATPPRRAPSRAISLYSLVRSVRLRDMNVTRTLGLSPGVCL